jgi:hypothetical protein
MVLAWRRARPCVRTPAGACPAAAAAEQHAAHLLLLKHRRATPAQPQQQQQQLTPQRAQLQGTAALRPRQQPQQQASPLRFSD